MKFYGQMPVKKDVSVIPYDYFEYRNVERVGQEFEFDLKFG